MKKKYEKMTVTVVKFETEDVLWTSGFFGDEDIMTPKSEVRSINSDIGSTISDQTNPT